MVFLFSVPYLTFYIKYFVISFYEFVLENTFILKSDFYLVNLI